MYRDKAGSLMLVVVVYRGESSGKSMPEAGYVELDITCCAGHPRARETLCRSRPKQTISDRDQEVPLQ